MTEEKRAVFLSRARKVLAPENFLHENSLNPCDKALQFANLAGFHASKPVVKLFSGTRLQHVSKLLDQFICLIDFGMQRPKQSKCFLVFSLQLERSAQKKENRLSCQHRRARKRLGCLGILPPFGKQADQMLIHCMIRMGIAISDQFPMQLSDIVTASFPSSCALFEMGIKSGFS